MNKIQLLTILNYIRKDLKEINRIDVSKISDEFTRTIAEQLQQLHNRGFIGFNSIKEMGLVMEGDKEKISNIIEILENIQHIQSDLPIHTYKILLEESGLKKKELLPTIRTDLAAHRNEVKELIRSQFNIEGFPLPIIGGKLNSIVAPSHSGKTIYAMGLAITLARAGKRVLFLSTEEGIDSFIEKTMQIDEYDKCWDNISLQYAGALNKTTLSNLIEAAHNELYDFIIIDYLKKSMWENYTSDHVVMEEINSTILRTIARIKSRISVFAFVQANREGYGKGSEIEELKANPGSVATFIDGGLPVYRSADNVLFIKNINNKRYLVVCKSRRNNEQLGKVIPYDVDLMNYNINFQPDSVITETVDNLQEKKKIRRLD